MSAIGASETAAGAIATPYAVRDRALDRLTCRPRRHRAGAPRKVDRPPLGIALAPMNTVVSTIVIVASLLLMLASLIVAIRNRPMGMVLLVGFAVLEVAILVQAGFVIAAVAGGEGPDEKVTLFGYVAGQVVIPPAGVFLALAERSRWGSAILVVAGFAIAVMTGRLLQIWQGGA
ncbi:hypothetical protein [Nonomuraea sp. NPDC050786]|uniref:hypothetical protein n=1 Tax=Nonomuraea sp. NPDC050786 TaxID=3154840 RepID=UPI003404207B